MVGRDGPTVAGITKRREADALHCEKSKVISDSTGRLGLLYWVAHHVAPLGP